LTPTSSLNMEAATLLQAVWYLSPRLRGPCSTQRQAQELISGPDLATGAQLLSFNRTQSRVVIGLLTGHNTFRRHILWGYVITPPVGNVVLRRTPQSTFCVSVRPWLHSDMHIWVPSFWTRRTLGY
jgi:hypothetical protein